VNTLRLQMRVKHTEGALVRVLGVTRRRRFDLLHLSAVATSDGSILKVEMTVQAERSGHTLVGQLAKLEDVSEVEILEPTGIEFGAQAAGHRSLTDFPRLH
jgi:acetolactate synthase regulatory subunit